MNDEKKLAKVENWGAFLLQKLHDKFSRGEYCDLVLQFANNDKLVVHSLVVHSCTEYFLKLGKAFTNSGVKVLHMPMDMETDIVHSIINFFYTGRLEYCPSWINKLYNAAKQMNLPVVMKLLDAQSAQKPSRPPPVTYPSGIKKAQQLNNVAVHKPTFTPTSKVIDPSLPETLPGRKLPIWKRRTVPTFDSTPYVIDDVGTRIIDPDDTLPTRLEITARDIPAMNVYGDIAYTTKKTISKPFIDEGTLRASPPPMETSQPSFEAVKRAGTTVIKRQSVTINGDESMSKRQKLDDLQAVKEYIQEHKLRSYLINKGGGEHEEVVDDVAVVDMDDDEDEDDDLMDDISIQTPVTSSVSVQKSILKTQPTVANNSFIESSFSPTTQSKRVRFSLASEEEGTTTGNTTSENIFYHNTAVNNQRDQQLPKPLETLTVDGNSGNSPNHAKIISEVLKKHPNLVKNNKNIKLKIVHNNKPGEAKSSKISYVMLKSDVAGINKLTLPISNNNERKPSKAENTTGPWLCYECGTPDEPVNFETYYSYRHHLQDVHLEKIDVRICEHCGYRASKRNLLLHHLYTKHNIPPPQNCQFPKCDKCDYVALSESLLIKHRNNHVSSKEFICKCGAVFRNQTSLLAHMQTNKHSSEEKRLYECPLCQKPFVRASNLRTHVLTVHKGADIRFEDEEDDIQDSEPIAKERLSGTKIEINSEILSNGVELLSNESDAADKSAEAEALNNVASGIATSLGFDTIANDQTVIVLDDGQEFVVQDSEIGSRNISEVIYTSAHRQNESHNTGSQEYIVPEIMPSDECSYQNATQDDSVASSDRDNIPPPSVSVENGVTMILSDHDYVEDVSLTKNDGVLIYIPQSDGSIKIMQHNMPLLQSEVISGYSTSENGDSEASNAVIISEFIDESNQSEHLGDERDSESENKESIENPAENVNMSCLEINTVPESNVTNETNTEKPPGEECSFSESANNSISEEEGCDETADSDEIITSDIAEPLEETSEVPENSETQSETAADPGEDSSVIVKTSSVTQVRPTLEMDDLVKEWDFDDDNSGENQDNAVATTSSSEQTENVGFSRYIADDEE